MNKKHIPRERVLNYFFELMSPAEAGEFESHLRECSGCRNALERVRHTREMMEREKAAVQGVPDDFQSVLARARREAAQVSPVRKNGPVRNPFAAWSLAIRLAAAGAVAAVVLGSVLVAVRRGTLDYLYLTRASGDVRVNHKPVFVPDRFIYRIEIGGPVRIGVGEGECDFQVNRDKAFGLGSLTEVLVRGGREIVMDFIKGTVVARTEASRNGKPLRVLANFKNAFFRVIGTKFYIQTTNRSLEFGVLEGNVEGTVSDKVFQIRPSEIIRIGEDFVEILTNRNLAVGIFRGVDRFEIRQDFRNTKPIVIRTEPGDTEVYWKNNLLGRAPLYYLGDSGTHRSVMLVKKGYISREIEIGRSERYSVSMKQEREPEETWSVRFPNRRVVNPVVTGDGHLLLVDESGLLMKIGPGATAPVWSFPAGARNNSQPVLSGGAVYFASADGHLYAVRYDTGRLIWKTRVGILVNSSPLVSNGRITVCSIDGQLTVLESAGGNVVVRKKFEDGFYSSPLIAEGTLYLGGMNGVFYALDPASLEIRSKYQTGDRIVGSRPLVHGGRIYFGSNDRYLYALDALTGKLAWKRYTGGEIFTSPVLLGEAVLIATVKGDVFGMDLVSGSVLWKRQTDSRILLDPALSGGKYVFLVSERTVQIFNRWGLEFTKHTTPYEITDYAVSGDQSVYLCGADGRIRNMRFGID